MKVIKYQNSKVNLTQLGSQISEWTKTKGDKILLEMLPGKVLQLCFSNRHNSQDKVNNLVKCDTRY